MIKTKTQSCDSFVKLTEKCENPLATTLTDPTPFHFYLYFRPQQIKVCIAITDNTIYPHVVIL